MGVRGRGPFSGLWGTGPPPPPFLSPTPLLPRDPTRVISESYVCPLPHIYVAVQSTRGSHVIIRGKPN